MYKLGRQHLKEAAELNITAFMNLMVILVPFLLITAVFSRMTILQLNLPGLNNKQTVNKKLKLSLELVLRENGFDIEDANIGVIKHFDGAPAAIDWNKFSNVLLEIKRRFPKTQNITLLVGAKVPYKTLIHVMDHVRSTDVVQGTSVETVQLFPNISIGNAEPLKSGDSASPVINSKTEKNASK